MKTIHKLNLKENIVSKRKLCLNLVVFIIKRAHTFNKVKMYTGSVVDV